MEENSVTPNRTLIGMAVAGIVTFLAYQLNQAIVEKLPIPVLTNSASLADKLSALVRTLIVALTTGAVMIFGVITIGLFLLTLKQIWQKISPNH
jgi:hypothetical protein